MAETFFVKLRHYNSTSKQLDNLFFGLIATRNELHPKLLVRLYVYVLFRWSLTEMLSMRQT